MKKGGFGEAMRAAAVAAGLLGSPESAQAQKEPAPKSNPWETTVKQRYPMFMRVGGEATIPYEYLNFCERHPEECKPFEGTESERMKRDEGGEFRRLELAETNIDVNTLPQLSDLQLFGVSEHWAVAGKRGGDCEDLALLKQRLLSQVRAFKPSNLLLSHVRTETGEEHIVLIARLKEGDYVLDNRKNTVAPWSTYVQDYGYTFVSRQSYLNPQMWLRIYPPQ